MKTAFNVSVLAVLLVVISSPCFAAMDVGRVTKERAKEWGMEIRAKANGPDEVWVELEFKPEGKLKDFSHVNLEIREGDTLLLGWTALREKRSSSGSVHVGCLVNRAYLAKVTLRIVTGHAMNYSGNDIHLKEFVDLERIR
jgi:hypothetical protein